MKKKILNDQLMQSKITLKTRNQLFHKKTSQMMKTFIKYSRRKSEIVGGSLVNDIGEKGMNKTN